MLSFYGRTKRLGNSEKKEERKERNIANELQASKYLILPFYTNSSLTEELLWKMSFSIPLKSYDSESLGHVLVSSPGFKY